MSYQPATTAEERPSAVTTTRHDSWASLVRHPGYARYFAAIARAHPEHDVGSRDRAARARAHG